VYNSANEEKTKVENNTTSTPVNTVSQEGGGFEFYGDKLISNETNNGDVSFVTSIKSISFLRIPILVNYKLSKSLALFAGPQINYLLNINSHNAPINYSNDFTSITSSGYSINRLYPSVTAGVGVSLNNRLAIEISTNHDRKIVFSKNNADVSLLIGLKYQLK
jgi:hypothetical protein